MEGTENINFSSNVRKTSIVQIMDEFSWCVLFAFDLNLSQFTDYILLDKTKLNPLHCIFLSSLSMADDIAVGTDKTKRIMHKHL